MRPHTWNFQEILRRRDRSRLLGALAILAIALSALLVIRGIFRVKTFDATMSAGNTEGIWHQFLLKLAQEARHQNLRLEAIVTEGTLDMRSRDEPLITGELIGVLSNALQILLPAGGGLLLVWGWLRNRVLTRRERRFDRFIALVSGVERRAIELEQSGTRDHQALRRLHRELSTIKDAALERIATGEAGADLLVASLFAHISDVRTYLAHLERAWIEPDAVQA